MQLIGPVLSIVPLGWGVALSREIYFVHRLKTGGTEVIGRVLNQQVKTERGTRYTTYTIGFTTLLGQRIEGERTGSPSEFEFFDGDEVLLYYDPNQPVRFLLVQELSNLRRYGWLALASLMLAICLFGEVKN